MSPDAGTRVGNYEILALLGVGGMGRVYKATDLKLQRTVALKFLPHLPGESHKERFLQEARAASALDHPNIGAIYGIEETTGGDVYIVMAYYDGENLWQRVSRGPLPGAQTVEIAMQTAQGLAEAHAKGIIHRDIKSSNIMLTRQGLVKLLDFGLAKTAGSATLTEPGTAVGTAAYMSPEQAAGRQVDQRTDIWSFGVVLYEMIGGRLPFHADSVPATLLAITTASPPHLQNVDPRLELIVQKCLAKDPAERYQSVRELLDDLSRLRVSGELPTRTLVVDTGEMLRRARAASSAQHSAEAAAMAGRRWRFAAIAVALLLVAVVAWWMVALRPAAQSPVEKRVVVLPFSNVGNDPANSAACDGLLETLTSRLTSLEQVGTPLWVVPASEVRRRKITDPAEAQAALHANLVVTGSVQRDANGVRMTVNLIDSRTLRQVGSAVVDDRLGNFSSLQDGAIATLARLMAVELNPRALGKSSGEAAAPLAYESYLKGLSYLQRYDKPANLDTAIQMFQTAVKTDPSFALAYARLAEAQWTKQVNSPDPGLVRQALENCKQAQRINGQLAPVHVTLGRIDSGTGKYDLAVQEFQRALELDPRSAEAYQHLSRAYESLGRTADAESTMKKAVALRPDNWDGYNSLGTFYLRSTRYAEAAEMFRKVLQLTPDNAAAYTNLGVTLNRLHDRAGARRMYEKAIALSPAYATYTNLAGLYYLDGAWGLAAETYEKALKLNDKDYRPWAGLASSYQALGQQNNFQTACRHALELAEADSRQDPNNAEKLGAVAYLSAQLGDRPKAIAHLTAALTLSPDSRDILYRAALVYHALGEETSALKYLSEALARGYARERVRQDPDWRNLRADPAFQALVH